jgi:hypothetical protein
VLADLLALLNARTCVPPTQPVDTFPDNPPIVLIPPLRAVNLSPANADPVTPQDVQSVAVDVLAHRLVVSGSDVAHGFLQEVLARVPVPG